MFKAEVGSLSNSVALIQGVWVHPQLRGRGLAAPAMAAVVQSIQRDLRRMPSLYVNQYNRAGPPDLRPDRVHPGRHVRLGAVLTVPLPSAGRRLGADQNGPRGSTLPKCAWRDRSRRLRPRGRGACANSALASLDS